MDRSGNLVFYNVLDTVARSPDLVSIIEKLNGDYLFFAYANSTHELLIYECDSIGNLKQKKILGLGDSCDHIQDVVERNSKFLIFFSSRVSTTQIQIINSIKMIELDDSF